MPDCQPPEPPARADESVFRAEHIQALERLLERLRQEWNGSGQILIHVTRGEITGIYHSCGYTFPRRRKKE